MSPDQQHRCTVHLKADGSPFLAFEPSSGLPSSYSASLATLDLKHGVSVEQARDVAARINNVLWGVSATVF